MTRNFVTQPLSLRKETRVLQGKTYFPSLYFILIDFEIWILNSEVSCLHMVMNLVILDNVSKDPCIQMSDKNYPLLLNVVDLPRLLQL